MTFESIHGFRIDVSGIHIRTVETNMVYGYLSLYVMTVKTTQWHSCQHSQHETVNGIHVVTVNTNKNSCFEVEP